MNAIEFESDNLNLLIQNMQHQDWQKRFDAGFRLGARAGELGEFAETLRLMALDQRCPSKYTAAWILREFGRKTMRQWSNNLSSLLCPTCFVFGRVQQTKLSRREPIIFCGCPVCGQSQKFVEVDRVVGVLDRGMPDTSGEQSRVMWVNWIRHRRIFDFDSVEIIQATDEDVERFVVQVGNDTNPRRQPQYNHMPCFIMSNCGISEKTVRFLERTFGQVEIGPNQVTTPQLCK